MIFGTVLYLVLGRTLVISFSQCLSVLSSFPNALSASSLASRTHLSSFVLLSKPL